MNYKEELDSPVSSSMSESKCLVAGVASIREASERPSSLPKLVLVWTFKEEFKESETQNAGKFEGSLGKPIVKGDNKKHQITTITRSGGRNLICIEKRAEGLEDVFLKVD